MSATHAALAARRAVVPARASASRRARRVSSRRGRATTTTTRAAVTEPATKITFEDALPSAVKDGASLTCVGAGVREKKIAIINVKVYAVALYVDADACKAALTTGATPLDGAFDKTLAIELARDVGGETFWDALEDAVTPADSQDRDGHGDEGGRGRELHGDRRGGCGGGGGGGDGRRGESQGSLRGREPEEGDARDHRVGARTRRTAATSCA